jgi:diaminobutyrate-2-oxoglutarate transaminase
MQGLAMPGGEVAAQVSAHALEQGLIIETAGPEDEVVKLFCPLTISVEDLDRGIDIIEQRIAKAMGRHLRQVS